MPVEAILQNLLSPVVLAFVLGIVAALVRSDLRIPDALYQSLSIYLLLAIGLKGGVALSKTPLVEFAAPAFWTLVLGIITPLIAFSVLLALRFTRIDAAAMAAHYGSVSAVTFVAAVSYAEIIGASPEGYMPALVALLEVPAIIIALLLASRNGNSGAWKKALHEVMTGKSIILLVGGVAIGWAAGERGMASVTPFFVHGFQGALALFLLEMGLVTAARLRDLASVGGRLIGFAIVIPVVHGALGVVLGTLAGLSPAGAAILGAMSSSASYIAAPAAVRIALPQANPTYYLTASLGITFPFNLTLGIPLYFFLATWWAA